MASSALTEWASTASKRLDELERIHRDARGSGPGRRWGTKQLNRSLLVVLLAQFQTFCRGLHDEAIDVHVRAATPAQATMLRNLLTTNRQLDHKNPRVAALGSDFGRLGLTLVPDLKAVGSDVVDALDRLETLVDFRNGVAHGNETEIAAAVATGKIAATLGSYREHRKTLSLLTATLDGVVASGLATGLSIPSPW